LVGDAPEKRSSTERFFDQLPGTGVFISELVIAEVNRIEGVKRDALLEIIKTFGPSILYESEEVLSLAREYVEYGVFPVRYTEDAEHVAYASCHGIPVLASWNLRHIVKLKTRREVRAVNTLLGYLVPEIVTPEEYIDGL